MVGDAIWGEFFAELDKGFIWTFIARTIKRLSK